MVEKIVQESNTTGLTCHPDEPKTWVASAM